jgi:hypothetical protein
MTRLAPLALVATFIAFTACRAHPDFCEGAPGNRCSNIDAPTDTPTTCTSSDQCTDPTPVCDIAGSMVCVQCVAPDQVSACSGTTPACGDDNTCRACKAHSDCASSACLDNGSCASESSVAYVDPAGNDNTVCTKAMPCTIVQKALATNRPYVKFHGTTDEAVTLSDKNVTFLADPGAKLTRTNNGNILIIEGTSKVAIYDLEISGASGTGVGISVASGGAQEVTLTRMRFANNLGGGVLVSGGVFRFVGNVFFNNGSQTGSIGGVSITTSQNGANRLDFNSFNKNQTQNGIGSAIHCVAGTFTAKNNIMSENGTLTNMEQVGGTCAHSYSIVRPGTLPSGNSDADPLFKNTTTGDLHIESTSPARGAADPGSDLTGIASRDIDGDLRTAPADIGADQVP